MIIREESFEKARKAIQKASELGEEVVFTSNDDELNRKILEKEKIDALLICQKGRKDRQKQIDSGFNQVMAVLAKKNNVTIGICLDELKDAKNEEKKDIVARIKQNVKLCSKKRLRMKFFSKDRYNLHDIKALGLVLGMPTWMTKEL